MRSIALQTIFNARRWIALVGGSHHAFFQQGRIMGIFRDMRERARARGDRGLIFNAYESRDGTVTGEREFVGLVVTEHDRAPSPIAFIPFADFFEEHPIADRLRRLIRLAQRIARNHELGTGRFHSQHAIRLENVLCERFGEDARVEWMARVILLPMSVMPEHFSPWRNWQAGFCMPPCRRGERPTGSFGFYTLDADAFACTDQRNSGTAEAPIVSTRASKVNDTALAQTAA